MKKQLVWLAAGALCLSVCACQGKKSDSGGGAAQQNKEKSQWGDAIDKAKNVNKLASDRDYEKEAKELSAE